MLESLYFVLALNIVGFLVAFKKQSDKLTDIAYAMSFAGIALYNAAVQDFSVVQWLLFAVVLLWATRLGSFLLYRVHVNGKDGRFDAFRGNFWKFGRFWLLQGVTAWVVMLPASFVFRLETSTTLNTMTIIGAAIALFGLSFESIADWQKFRFSQDPKQKGKWIESGLWKFSRHPNYFGEILMWYGVFTAAVSWLADRDAYLSIVSPLTIAALLIGVSGIPILEKAADKRWGSKAAYREYRRRTSILIPMPNKRQ